MQLPMLHQLVYVCKSILVETSSDRYIICLEVSAGLRWPVYYWKVLIKSELARRPAVFSLSLGGTPFCNSTVY